jgi:hypothetical protein
MLRELHFLPLSRMDYGSYPEPRAMRVVAHLEGIFDTLEIEFESRQEICEETITVLEGVSDKKAYTICTQSAQERHQQMIIENRNVS